MENWSRFKHDTINNVFGKQKTPTIVGTLVTFVYTVLIIFAPIELAALSIEFVPYLGPFVGGAVAGGLRGTNAYDGFMYGFRAAAYGFVFVAVAAAIGSYVLLLTGTGQQYLLVSSLVGLIVLFALVPLMGLAGAMAGAVGTVVRRMVVPEQYNPPIR